MRIPGCVACAVERASLAKEFSVFLWRARIRFLEAEAHAKGHRNDAVPDIAVERDVVGDLGIEHARLHPDLGTRKEIIVDPIAVEVADIAADMRNDVAVPQEE